MANDFPSRTKAKLYDSIILTGYRQRDLDWRRRGRPPAHHRRRRPVATTLTLGRFPGALINLLSIHTYAGTFNNAHVCRRRLFPDLSPFRRRVGRSRAHFYRGENGWQMSLVTESDCAAWQD